MGEKRLMGRWIHQYFVRPPLWLRAFYGRYTWRMPPGRGVYLTFDDGPHPEVTPWVLDLLKAAHAKATFFCIGKNVARYPDVYARILREGHAVGNHTYRHLNGWEVSKEEYWGDAAGAAKLIDSNLFRPPYGRITRKQGRGLSDFLNRKMKVIMWDVLSADFDTSFTPAECLRNVVDHMQPGSIIVFHDSEKARANLEGSLPQVLEFIKGKGLECWPLILDDRK
jgi:peptidoglycan/xylan/chitin deacetylase (PgdA/CDA1 family)